MHSRSKPRRRGDRERARDAMELRSPTSLEGAARNPPGRIAEVLETAVARGLASVPRAGGRAAPRSRRRAGSRGGRSSSSRGLSRLPAPANLIRRRWEREEPAAGEGWKVDARQNAGSPHRLPTTYRRCSSKSVKTLVSTLFLCLNNAPSVLHRRSQFKHFAGFLGPSGRSPAKTPS